MCEGHRNSQRFGGDDAVGLLHCLEASEISRCVASSIGVCHYIRGHGAIERKGKAFEMNMWLVLVRSVEWKVFESFEIGVRGEL